MDAAGAPWLCGSLIPGLITQPRQAFVPAQDRKHFENAGRGGFSGQCHAQGLGNRAELTGAIFLAIDHDAHGLTHGLVAATPAPAAPARVPTRARAGR